MPKVSVIIPTYNRAQYLSEALDSVFSQTYQDFEIIVVDDGSIDNTNEIIKTYADKYPVKIKYFYQRNTGTGAARNRGINEAEGDYIAFLDSDDLWLKEKLKIQVDILDNNLEVALTYCRATRINNKGEILDIKPAKPALKASDFLYNHRIPPTVMIRKSCLQKVGIFDAAIRVGEDTDLWLRISLEYKIIFFNRSLTIMRAHDNNISLDTKWMYLGHTKIINKLIDRKIKNNFSKRTLEDLLANNFYGLSRTYFHNNKNFKLALKYSLKAVLINPFVGKDFLTDNDSLLRKIRKILNPFGILFFSLFKSATQKPNSCIRILFYESSSGCGGSASALACLINNINRERFYPLAAITNYGSKIKKINNVEIIKLNHYKEPKKLSNFRFLLFFIRYMIPRSIKLYWIIKSKKIALVHINTNINLGILAVIAARLANIPCVCHIRQTRELIKREIFFIKWVAKFIVLNKKAFQMHKEFIPEEKLNIVYDGIGMNEFVSSEVGTFRKEFNFNSLPLIGVIGRIIEGKGQKEFILAAKEVLKTKPEAKFVVVGDARRDSNEYFNEIKELVKKENVHNSIIFTDWRNDIDRVIADLDILVQSTTTFPEGFGLTILEAMALNKPVIATDIPGPSDIVVDGDTGFLVPPSDINAMAEKIIYLISNPAVAKQMGEKGRKRVEELFDIKERVKDIERIYAETLFSKQ